MFNLYEAICGYEEHPLTLQVVYTLEGCDHSMSKREHFVRHCQTQYGFYALTREYLFYFVRAGALEEVSVIREDYYGNKYIAFFSCPNIKSLYVYDGFSLMLLSLCPSSSFILQVSQFFIFIVVTALFKSDFHATPMLPQVLCTVQLYHFPSQTTSSLNYQMIELEKSVFHSWASKSGLIFPFQPYFLLIESGNFPCLSDWSTHGILHPFFSCGHPDPL